MAHEKQWAGLNIQFDGTNIAIKYSDMTVRELTTLFRGALLEVPFCKEAMELAIQAIEKTKPKLMNREVFIHNLRLLRQYKNIKARDLANKLSLDADKIYNIENNPNTRVDEEVIDRIAQYFKIDANVLTSIKAAVTFNNSTYGKEE